MKRVSLLLTVFAILMMFCACGAKTGDDKTVLPNVIFGETSANKSSNAENDNILKNQDVKLLGLISVENFEVLDNDRKIWSYYKDSEGFYHFVSLDTLGNITDDRKCKTKYKGVYNAKVLENDILIIEGHIDDKITGHYYVHDLNTMEDITSKYVNGDEEIIFADRSVRGGSMIVKQKKEESYSDLSFMITVMDVNANIRTTFSTKDLAEKFDLDWSCDNFYMDSLENGIYTFETGYLDYLGIIDCVRDKTLVINEKYITKYGSDNFLAEYSDGDYIAFYSDLMGYDNLIFDLKSEQFIKINDGYVPTIINKYFENKLDKSWSFGLRDEKIYCWNKKDDTQFAFIDISTNNVVDLTFDDAKPYIISAFTSGYAAIDFKNKYLTIIDDKGTMQFEPVDAHLSDGYSFAVNGQVYFSAYTDVNGEEKEILINLDGEKTVINTDCSKYYDRLRVENKEMLKKFRRFLSYENSELYLVDYYYNGTNFEFAKTKIN